MLRAQQGQPALSPTVETVKQSTDCVAVVAAMSAASSGSWDLPDLDLVRLAQAGDSEAFGILVDRHQRAVFRAALAGVGSATEADDVAQEAFVAAFRKLGDFRGQAAFRTWMLAITWRKAMDRRKGLSRWLRSMVAPVAPPGVAEDSVDFIERVRSPLRSQEEELSGAELQRTIRQLIGTLPRKLRDPLLLAGSGDYSYEQIGGMLGVPLGTVKWRVSEARRLLKQKLAALGYRQ
jgi:RNA polymerase sigma-70 factor, ECF subfamily